jgi:hypothetical protein
MPAVTVGPVHGPPNLENNPGAFAPTSLTLLWTHVPADVDSSAYFGTVGSTAPHVAVGEVVTITCFVHPLSPKKEPAP